MNAAPDFSSAKRIAHEDALTSSLSEQTDALGPLRVMHVLDRLDVGGTEKTVIKLIRSLDPGLFEHYICTLRGTAQTARQWAPNVKLLNGGREGAAFQFNVPRLVRIMRAIRPAIVHSRNWGGIEAIVAARLAGVPVALHSEHGYELDMRLGLPLHRRVLRHLVYRMGDAVATVTRELRDYHSAQAWWKQNCIRVLYNGVDAREFRPQPQVREAVRRQLSLPADALVLGSVGRMVPLKDFLTLLKAARNLAPEVSNLHVVLVGSGPELDTLRNYVADCQELSRRVLFAGTLDYVADVLNAMDIFVLPTLIEGMSNTLLEAMAVGLPVVATRVGGNPEVVSEGACGYLFTPQDVSGLTCLLRTLLRDEHLRREFGSAARQRALQEFSLEAMVGRYSNLYLDLASRRSAFCASRSYVRN